MTFRLAPASTVLAFLAACSAGTEGTPSPLALVTDSAGVELVRNPPVTVEAHLVEELRIGTMEGEEPYQLFRVGWIDVHRSGDVYVANSGSSTVRVFAPDGAFRREFGGQGQGPGEFPALGSVTLVGDTVLVHDFQAGAVLLTLEGEYLGSWPTFRPDTRETIAPVGRVGSRWMAVYRPALDPTSLRPGLWVDTVRYHVWSLEDGAVGDEVVAFPGPVRILGSRGEASAGPLFEPTPAAGSDTVGYLHVTAGDVYRIDVVDTSGRLVRRISRDHEVRPILEAWIEDFRSRVTDFYAQGPADSRREVERDRIVEERTAVRSARLPPTGQILVASDGAFWVERTDLAENPSLREFQRSFGYGEGEPPPTTWDIFDARGFYVATVDVPAVFRPYVVEEGAVLGVLRGDMDVEYVVRYRVEVGQGG